MLFINEKAVSIAPSPTNLWRGFDLSVLRNLKTISVPSSLMELLPEIRKLADNERNGLGFLPHAAIVDAIDRKKLIALVNETEQETIFVGYILYSGVFPHAKVQQIATVDTYRKLGVGSALVRSLISSLENIGFTTLRADIADDLSPALAFYKKNGFVPVKEKPGGSSRNRNIVIHIRDLETETLFSKPGNDSLNLGIRNRASANVPFYTLDLNVYFDLAKSRKHAECAGALFSAAMDHSLRLTVANEFVDELKRTSASESDDPILQLALQLPRLPKVSSQELQDLREKIHEVVFVAPGSKEAHSAQALSDATHLAHATLARATAFVTRDAALIRSSPHLIKSFGIDVVSIDDLLKMLPPEQERISLASRTGHGFSVEEPSLDEVSAYFTQHQIQEVISAEFSRESKHDADCWRRCVRAGAEICGIAVLISPRTTDRVCRLTIHCREEALNVDLYADHLLDLALREASRAAVSAIELVCPAGQPTLTANTKARGFLRQDNNTALAKIVLGRPISRNTWPSLARETRRRTGLELPERMPDKQKNISVKNTRGDEFFLSRNSLEELLGPTIIAWRDRDGVLIPIRYGYSQQLLGASPQLSLLDKKDAEFLSLRSYVGDPRSASIMRPDAPLLFYESMSEKGGAGAVVAVAKIVDAVVYPKLDITPEKSRRLVVEDVAQVARSEDVLVTSFNNVFTVPQPVPLSSLRAMQAVDDSNLITARQISGKLVNKILDEGWGNA